MALTIVFTILSLLGFLGVKFFKIKGSVICALLSVALCLLAFLNGKILYAVIVALLSALFIIIISNLNVNVVIKSSVPVYVISLILLVAVILFNTGSVLKRYLILGNIVIEPASLVVFSILPVAYFLGRMKRITFSAVVKIIMLTSIELFLLALQPNLQPAIAMFFVILFLLYKVKADNHGNFSWFVPIFITGVFSISFFYLGFRSGILNSFLETVWTRGANAPLGEGYFLSALDKVLPNALFIGRADTLVDGIEYLGVFVRGTAGLEGLSVPHYIVVPIILKYGWVFLGFLVAFLLITIISIFAMSAKIKNLFAKYVCFSIGCYFAFTAIVHLISEFFLPYAYFSLPFFGDCAKILIDSALLGIVLCLYSQRKKITVNCMPDIDYDLAKEVVNKIEEDYEEAIDALPADKPEEKEKLQAVVDNIKTRREKNPSSETEILSEVYGDYAEEFCTKGADASVRDTVFISYRSLDEKYVEFLSKEIEKHGIKTWYSGRDCSKQRDNNLFTDSIVNAFAKTKIFVVVVSKNSIESTYVLNEINMAITRKQRKIKVIILPVNIDNTDIYETSFEPLITSFDITFAIPPETKKKLKDFAKAISEKM